MTSPMRPLPPSAPESVVARRVLVLAPHYDDEVLGCGGLILQLAAGGAKVACAFMSDGSGGVEGPPEGFTEDEYSERRKAEADAAAKVLGIGSVEHLGSLHGLRDGSLASSLDRLTGSVEALLEQHKPDLLLAPSPLEATRDHQATFRALHEALINRRQGRTEEGEELASQDDDSSPGDLTLRVFCYEVNHPFYPDLLVDVTTEMEEVAEAMSRYSSQLERHDYMASCQGLRRFRSLSLPDSCRYAEGYCQLKASDFTTRSPAQLIAHLGGAPSLVEVTSPRRVSIVVRTYNRPRRLAEALDSLARSTYRNVELVLVNDGGRPPEVAEDFPFDVRRVDFEDNRGRSAAAQAGVEAATGDCVGFLDDDDVFAPEHLETLTAQLSGDVDVAYTDAAVVSYRPGDGGWVECGRRLAYSRDFDRGILLLDNYIPFHTVLMTREAIERAGPFDEELPVFEDWDLLIRLSRGVDFVHIARTTCEYRHFLGGGADGVTGGHALGGAASSRGDFEALKARVLAKHAAELDSEALAGAVTRMRREAVLAGVAARDQIRDRERELERLRAEIESLRAWERELQSSHEERGAEVERLQTREQELESSHEELGAEVERLQAREQELESSHEELGAEVSRLQGREQELESSHEELGSEVSRLQAREQELESSHEELGAEVSRLQAREQELESSHEELGAEVSRLQAREQELESSHEELGAEVSRLQAREQELESSHEELGSEVSRLQAREQELESSHEELGSEVARLQARERELESSHEELGAEVSRLQAREQELESSHEELGAEVSRLQAREQELESSHEELGAEVARLQARERELESSLRELSSEVERLQARERELQADVEAVKATRAWRLHERLRILHRSGD